VLYSKYICDKKFDTSVLEEEKPRPEDTHAFIIIDGEGALFALQMVKRVVILKNLSVNLPKKHRRGGQSALRFERLREEKRFNFLKKVSENAKTLFLKDNIPKFAGLVLAGKANLKNELIRILDPRLQKNVLRVVNISYGGNAGLREALFLSEDLFSKTRFQLERQFLQRYFRLLANDDPRVCFGVEEVAEALEQGVLDTLTIHENFDEICGKNGIPFSHKNFQWFVDRAPDFSTKLEIISGFSAECNQFVKGFCGLLGLKRYYYKLTTN